MFKPTLNLIAAFFIAISGVTLSPVEVFAGGSFPGRSTQQDNAETQRLYNLEKIKRDANSQYDQSRSQGSQAADPRTLENGYSVSGTASAANDVSGMDMQADQSSSAARIKAGNERAAMCGMQGMSCDDDGNATQTFSDGSTRTEHADGRVTTTNSTENDPTPGGANTSVGGKTASAEETECDGKASTARSACLMPGTGGMDEGTAAMFSMMMTVQLPAMVTQISSIGKNMSQQCKVQADMSKLMASINGIKGAACATTISSCNSTCKTEATDAQTAEARAEALPYNAGAAEAARQRKIRLNAKAKGSQCSAYTGQVVGMMMSAMQSGVAMVANNQCASDLAAFSAAAPTYTPPTLATVGGCEDPNNQTIACYCSRAGNATSAMCAGFTGGSLVGGSTTTTPNGSTVASPYASTVAGTDDGNTVDPFANPAKKSGGDGKGQGDGGSGAPGGGISSLSSEGGGAGQGGDPKSAITGTSGGTGSGLGGSGGGGGGGLARNNGAGGGAGNGFFDKFNLKKFLPGSKYKTRGIAGMSVKSVDGITGPMGPSLFEKATRQYQEQIQKQTVILDK